MLELQAVIVRKEMDFPEVQVAIVGIEPELFALGETLCVLKVDIAPREIETGRTEGGPPELKDDVL